MQLHLLALGKLRTPGLRESADYYARNLQPWIHLKETELKPVAVSDKSAASRKIVQKKEAALLRDKVAALAGKKMVFVMDETGKGKSTEDWAKLFQTLESDGTQHAVFCLGGSLGFEAEFRRSAQAVFSLGPQTLSHELARVVLLEQLYRSFSVIRGHPYHNSGS